MNWVNNGNNFKLLSKKIKKRAHYYYHSLFYVRQANMCDSIENRSDKIYHTQCANIDAIYVAVLRRSTSYLISLPINRQKIRAVDEIILLDVYLVLRIRMMIDKFNPQ